MMKQKAVARLAMVLLVFLLPGCGRDSAPDFKKIQNGMTAVLSMSPASPAMMEPVRLSLTLTDAKGQVLEGADVKYDLTMPGMAMAPNRPLATDEGQGLYLAQATFTMSGDWRAQAVITYSGETTTFTFDFPVE
jgi:hypothetical protein